MYDVPTSSSHILRHTHPFPTVSDLAHKTAYIPGGIRVGARYPDIIINKQDVERGAQFMKYHGIRSIDDICHRVNKIFNVKRLLNLENFLSVTPPWGKSTNKYYGSPYNYAESCFDRKVFNCNRRKVCKTRRRSKPNTLTNIMALPYIFGDCREIAWFAGFLCHVANFKPGVSYRICYSTLYSVLDDEKQIHEVMDHVFTVAVDGDLLKVVDPCNMIRTKNTMLLHDTIISPIKSSEFRDYSSESDIHERIKEAPVFECGKIFVNGIQKDRLIAVPKIYDGGIRWINTSPFLKNPDEHVLFWNSPVPYSPERTWYHHKEWC